MQRLTFLALRNLWRNQRRTLVTMAAILLGTFAVTVLRGFFNGFIDGVRKSVVEAETGALQVHKAGYLDSRDALPLKLDMAASPELEAQMRSIPGVTAVSGRIMFGGLVSNGISGTNFMALAVEPGRERAVTPASDSIITQGLALADDAPSEGIFGSEMASAMGAGLGNSLTISTSDQKGGMNAMDLIVRGTLSSPIPFAAKKVIRVPLPFAQKLLKMDGRVTEYALNVSDLADLPQVAAAMQAKLGPEYQVSRWDEVQPFVTSIIFRQTLILSIFTFVLFIITLTLIVNTMMMSVTERVREIGTMMAVGVRRRAILRLFLTEAGLLGATSGLLGAGLGTVVVLILGVHGIHFVPPGNKVAIVFTPFMKPSFVALAVAVALVGALVAALYPAWRASRLNPVDALRSL